MSTIAQMKRYRFLFVLWEGGGNVPPILGLARTLVERGHRVRVISDPCNEAEVKAAGCEFAPYRRAPHRFDKAAASTIVNDYEAKNPTQALYTFFDKIACGPALAYAQDVLDALENSPADVVVVSEGLFGGHFAAEKAGLPNVMVIPSGYNFYAPGMPPPGMLPLSGPLGWLRDKFYAAMFKRLSAYALPGLQTARKALALPELKTFSQYLDQLDRILLLTSAAFDFEATFPPNARFVGPVLDDPAWVETWQSPWPADHPDPLAMISFSTTFQNQGGLIQRTIDALDGMQVRGLVTLGPSLEAGRFRAPANVVVRQSVPHTKVFPHAAAMITHAGHGTVIRALAYGVPLVCIPMGRDQPGNAARVVANGAGLRLDAARADAGAIRQAVQRVVNEPAFRQNAQRLAQSIAHDRGTSPAVDELEHLAAASAPERAPVR